MNLPNEQEKCNIRICRQQRCGIFRQKIFGAETKKQDAKIESAVIEIGGKIYEGKNHAKETILKKKSRRSGYF